MSSVVQAAAFHTNDELSPGSSAKGPFWLTTPTSLASCSD